ncbi:MAG: exodeoxyribonuclease III [Holosporales bacterium]|nr:exodeoxyribonuclease III [Holosporales bacterium]
MRIATWNVNSIRVRVDQLATLLQRYHIDTVLLQELKCANEVFPREMLEDLGYNCAVFGQKSYNGVAILSKHLIEDVTFGCDIFRGDSQARYVEALVNGFKVASVYVPNGQDVHFPAYMYKLKFLEILLNHLSKTIKIEKYIIGGDFNIARSDLDVYDPQAWNGKVCCTERERNAFEELLKIGLVDCQRVISENDRIYTWWDYRSGHFAQNKGLRLDYILTTKDVLVKCGYVDTKTRTNIRPSDHAPVIVDVE